MADNLREMARLCYGYGNWAGPYWFIGPEQGQARRENNDLEPRIKAWLDLSKDGLSDCRAFHAHIGETRWHRDRPRLQSTWRPLMLLMMTALGRPTDNETLRNYQRDRWGSLSDETCVIELSGRAAHSFKIERERKLFRQERIEVIREKMLHFKPALVVMYGLGQKSDWEAITQKQFPSDGILRIGSTNVIFTPHPTSRGLTNVYWRGFGERLLPVS